MAGLLIITGVVGLASPRDAAAQEEAAIEATVQAIENAWNSGDAFGFRDFFTEQGFESEFGFPKSDVQQLAEIIGEPPVTATVENVILTDGTATADISLDFSGAFSEQAQWTFVLADGRWRVDSTLTIAPEIPEGSTVVDVQLDEYEFIYDPAAIAAGDSVAFSIENIGEENHEFVLFRLTSSEPLLDLLEQEEPEGVEFLAATEAGPGESTAAIIPGTLAAGRYGIVCFFPSPDGTPHAFLGMASEFNVGAGGGTVSPSDPSPISPPNTGDGGLLAGPAEDLSSMAIVFGSLMMALCLLSFVRARRNEEV